MRIGEEKRTISTNDHVAGDGLTAHNNCSVVDQDLLDQRA